MITSDTDELYQNISLEQEKGREFV